MVSGNERVDARDHGGAHDHHGRDGDGAERDRGQDHEAVALDEADPGEAERGGGG